MADLPGTEQIWKDRLPPSKKREQAERKFYDAPIFSHCANFKTRFYSHNPACPLCGEPKPVQP